MAVLRFHKVAEETGTGESTTAIESGCMAAELTEDSDASNFSLRQLPAPETVATSDLATKLAAADAAISTLQRLLDDVRISYDELGRTLHDLKRDRDDWRERAERLSERPWWRRLAG